MFSIYFDIDNTGNQSSDPGDGSDTGNGSGSGSGSGSGGN